MINSSISSLSISNPTNPIQNITYVTSGRSSGSTQGLADAVGRTTQGINARIDNLLNSPSISGLLSAANGSFSGDLSVAGSLTVSGSQSLSGALGASYFTASDASATSTFAGGLQAGGASGLYVLQNGNVGIGTTNPTTKLDVNGNIYVNSNIYNTDYITKTPEKNNWINTLPLASTWTDAGYSAIPDPTDVMRQPQIIKQNGVYYIFNEYDDVPNKWLIGVWYSSSLSGPWTFAPNIVPVSTQASDPDYVYVADPSVLYVPWAEHKWQMWFDMDGGVTPDYAHSTIGHAYADNPLGPWTKQQTNGVTDIVIGPNTSTFTGFANDTHSPECFMNAGSVNCLYASEGTGHTTFDTMLAVANDSQGLGTSFENWGPVTTDNTIATGDAYRLQSPFTYQSVLYAIMENTTYNKYYWVSSTDGGKSWMQLGQAAYPFHSFLVEGSKIYGITQSHGSPTTFPMKFYYLDLENVTGYAPMVNDVIGAKTNLPITNNVYSGYYVQGDTDLYRSAASTWRTSGSLIVDGSIYQKAYTSEDGLILYWPFNENTGVTVYDHGPKGHDATLSGITASWGTGVAGYSVSVVGSGQVGTSDDIGINASAPATIETWFYITTDAMTRGASNSIFTQLYQHSANNYLYLQNGSDYFKIAPSTGTWHHLVLVKTGLANSTSYLFLDGVKYSITLQTNSNYSAFSTFSVGGNTSASNPIKYDETRVYNRALSDDEVKLQYLRGAQSSGVVVSDKFRVINSSATELLHITSTGNVGIGTTTPTLGPLTMNSGAYVTTGGVWTNASDRNSKENFATVTPTDILTKINALPITEWNYKAEGSAVKHVGPVAQDFYALFGLGGPAGDTSISTIDPAGVALVGIQALSQRLEAIATAIGDGANTLKNLVLDSLTSTTIYTRDINADKLCLGATCITETELKDLLQKNNIQIMSTISPSVPSPDQGEGQGGVNATSTDITASTTDATSTSEQATTTPETTTTDTATSTPSI